MSYKIVNCKYLKRMTLASYREKELDTSWKIALASFFDLIITCDPGVALSLQI